MATNSVAHEFCQQKNQLLGLCARLFDPSLAKLDAPSPKSQWHFWDLKPHQDNSPREPSSVSMARVHSFLLSCHISRGWSASNTYFKGHRHLPRKCDASDGAGLNLQSESGNSLGTAWEQVDSFPRGWVSGPQPQPRKNEGGDSQDGVADTCISK